MWRKRINLFCFLHGHIRSKFCVKIMLSYPSLSPTFFYLLNESSTKAERRTSLQQLNSLSKAREHELKIIRMQTFHQANIGCVNKRTLEDGLQQAVGCHLYHHSTFRYMSKCFLEEDRREQVIHMVRSRRVLCQRRVPSWFRDRRTDPTRRAQLRVWNNLQTCNDTPSSCFCILMKDILETGPGCTPFPSFPWILVLTKAVSFII